MLFAPASASFRIPMICSSVNRLRFIAGPPRGHPSRADSHFAWTSFRGAGRVRYHIGDKVLVTLDAADLADLTEMDVSPGETGTIRRIGVNDPNDGDATSLYF